MARKPKTETETAVAVMDAAARMEVVRLDDYALMQVDMERYAAVQEANVGGTLTIRDLDVITMPSGGAGVFSIADPLSGKDRKVETIQAVILHWHMTRAYWTTAYGEGEAGLPDCRSEDGRRGIGEPGGDCATCPMAQWGSKGDPRSPNAQACNQQLPLYIQMPDSLQPRVLRASATSIAPVQRFMRGLAGNALLFYHEVAVEFSLDDAKSDTGLEFNVLTMKLLGRLDPETHKRIELARAGLLGALRQQGPAYEQPVDEDFEPVED